MTWLRGSLLRRMAYRVAGAGMPFHSATPATTVPEITPMPPRHAVGDDRSPRLNILLPSINVAHYFGGIHTAVSLYRALCQHYPRSRIILTDSAPDTDALARFSDHIALRPEDDSTSPRQIVAFNDRYGRTIPVEEQDQWLATAWWTAFAAQQLGQWQQQTLGGEARRIAYFIQDFEPGFYPWSSQYALALSTYRPTRDVAIFNTGLLADFFEQQGLAYERKLVHEPTLNDAMRPAQHTAAASDAPRARRIVVYGRPSTPRNAFELICEALRHWGWTDPCAADWEIVAPGELLEDVDLGSVRIKSLGKLDIHAYAELLSTSAVGLSLMISPHPSYPPLEMAAFRMTALTNKYANKDLSGAVPGVHSLNTFDPAAIAYGVAQACAGWEASGMRPTTAMPEYHPFLRASDLPGLALGLQEHLQHA